MTIARATRVGRRAPEVIARQQGDPLSGGCYDDVAHNTLVIAGSKSPQYMRNAQAAIAAAAPRHPADASRKTHMVKAKATAPADFLA